MKRPTALAFLVLLIPFLTGSVNGQSPGHQGHWPQWRGTARDGLSNDTGLLQQWAKPGPPLLWTATGLGPGHSTVSVVAGTIYTMGEQDGQGHLIALDEQNGTAKWTFAVGEGRPLATPTVDNGQVFALGSFGDLVCVDATGGNELWRLNIVEAFQGVQANNVGYSESPLVDGDRVVITPGDQSAIMVAVDRTTGDLLWKADMHDYPGEIGEEGANGAGFSSIVVSRACGVRQYVQLTGRGVISVRADDGKILWVYNRVANPLGVIATPVVHEDFVFCSTAYNTGSALLRVVPDKSDIQVEEVYFLEPKVMQNHHGGMVLVGGHIYCGHGQNSGLPLCVEMRTGKVVWRPGRGPGTGSAAVAYADGHLYFRYEDGLIALIEATPEKYLLKGTFMMGSTLEKSWPHPVITGGRLYLRDDDALLCYDVRQRK